MFCIKTPSRWPAFVFLGASLWPAPDLLAEPLAAMSEAPVCELPSTLTSEALVNKCLGCAVCIDCTERMRCKPIALLQVTVAVIKQKSADGIVAKCPA